MRGTLFSFWLLRLMPVVLLAVNVAWAQSLEVISLQHRRAEELLPRLKPFVEPGGTLGGMNDTLFLRASARNQAEVRQLLATLDVPIRRLLVSMRLISERADEADGADAAARVTVGGDGAAVSGRVKVYSSDRQVRRDVRQQVQTIDGGRAVIHAGRSYWVPLRQVRLTPAGVVVSDTYVQRDLGTGFVALPRLSGDQVTLEISPHDAVADANAGVQVQSLQTTVSGGLGEWLTLGGSTVRADARESGITRYGTRAGDGSSRIQLKVEVLP